MISFFPCSTVLFADPTDEEENLVTGIVTVVITDDDKIAAVHKPGNMCFGDLTILGQAKKNTFTLQHSSIATTTTATIL